MPIRFIISLFTLSALLLACGGADSAQSTQSTDQPLTVFVSVLPLQQVVERIGGEHVEVHVLVGPGQSPATYQVTPRQIDQLSSADLLFRVGVPFEETLIPRIEANCPDLTVVDLREGLPLRHIEEHEGDDHDHGGADPHTWLDPSLVQMQAESIADFLCAARGDNADEFEANLTSLLSDLDGIDVRITEILAPHRGQSLFVFHPSYGHFADRYGLHQRAIETGGREPGSRHLNEVIDEMRAEGVHTIFVQPQFASNAIDVIADALGAEIVTLDPLAPDLLGNYEIMARDIAAGLGEETPQ